MSEVTPDVAASLIESVARTGSEIAADAVEITMDRLLEDGVLRDIPIVGWLEKGRQAYRSITEALFLKKVVGFLAGTATASGREREQFVSKLGEDDDHCRRVGEALVLFIERHERFEKSELLGRLLACQMRGMINEEEFLLLASAIDRANVEDLVAYSHSRTANATPPGQVQEGLFRAGLCAFTIDSRPAGAWPIYSLNDLGRKFFACVFPPPAA